MNQKARHYREQLGLIKHPEGGYYKEVYCSGELILAEHLAKRYKLSSNFSSSIYFLLKGNQFSAFNLLQSNELWHFYDGRTVVIYNIDETGNLSVKKPGKGYRFQLIIEKQNWFTAEVENKKSFSLFVCTVSPGFEFEEFEHGKWNTLSKDFPQHGTLIKQLTNQ